VGNFQYLSACVAFSVSRPFRKPLYTNTLFILSLFILVSFSTLLVLADLPFITDFFVLVKVTEPEQVEAYNNYRKIVLLVAVVNFFVTYFAEKFVIWQLSLCLRRREEGKMRKAQNKLIRAE
jgi:cation-transporting ATPase 13A3/4/5